MKRLPMAMICCAVTIAAALLVPARARAQGPTDDDKKFLAFAAQADQNEIAVSELAEKKATNPDVKSLAARMVREHKQMTASMKPFAEKWGITPPAGVDDDHRKEIEKLNGLSGADFDKRYIDDMVSDHATALDKFTSEAKDTKDKPFQKAVIEAKTKVAAHKNMAYDLKKKL